MKKIILFIILTSLFFIHCSDSIDDPQWFIYAETQCADPWETNTSNNLSEVENAVRDYLENIDVAVGDVEVMDADSSIVTLTCLACDCPSGRGLD